MGSKRQRALTPRTQLVAHHPRNLTNLSHSAYGSTHRPAPSIPHAQLRADSPRRALQQASLLPHAIYRLLASSPHRKGRGRKQVS
ncbi:hypothetical protein RSOL_294320 [Rhizoctonia solani AG-3 Rhs1AP]|uniref:Uncharacterized protein n=1 Tax=Rhizoctonia solani AG-3 Rhs1AP TaxID=1086054 RepID=A0A0A1UKV8_9AGAM|nr:hypothetical protein RSOL_294320 [Rhizoctonia solani AG-3 Rhs1AP]